MLHDRLTPEELSLLPAKTKKNPAVVDLYLQNDYLTAYAKHTDMRVAESPEGAIGSHLEWECHGDWQRDFLISQGLEQDDYLLEIGCGTGRLARKLVPWMVWATYWGVDISEGALAHCRSLAVKEGWSDKGAEFVTKIPERFTFDYVWAFSVFIHLPADVMRQVFRECAAAMNPDGKFYFSYVPEIADTRTGLKQFRHTLATYRSACHDAGLSFKDIGWPHQQRIGLARRVDLGST